MSIANEIQRLNRAKADIKTALESKGITVPSSFKIDGYAQLIESIVPDTRVTAKFNVTDTSNPTKIGYDIGYDKYTSGFSAIEIDGVVQPSVVSAYTFSTTGVHTVKYTLTDPTTIGDMAFRSCSGLTSIDIPYGVTSIGQGAFNRCSGLTSINIPNSVTSIGEHTFEGCSRLTSINIPSGVTSIGQYTFYDCSSLTSCIIGNGVTSIGYNVFVRCSSITSIVCNATTAPTIERDTFYGINTGGTLTVPSGSSGYNVWMGTGNYYLGSYNWTKVEQ